MSKMINGFKLIEGGVIRKFDGACIPDSPGNRDWKEYQEWLAEGNTPDPEFTPEELARKPIDEEITQLRQDLRNVVKGQFEMILEIWKALKLKGIVTNDDVDPDVLAKASNWAAKLNRLKELGDN